MSNATQYERLGEGVEPSPAGAVAPGSLAKCSVCKGVSDDFSLKALQRGNGYCRPCQRKYSKDRRTRLMAEMTEESTARCSECGYVGRDFSPIYIALGAGLCRPCMRDRWTKKAYGITTDEWDAMFERQGGKCPICEQPLDPDRNAKPRRVHVDHCHETGRVRGLLDAFCNTVIMAAVDRPELIERGKEYAKQA